MKAEDLRVMVVGAHPDDPDLNFGGTAARFARMGARVRFVSVCNGSKGHRELSEEALAARRYGEMQRSAAIPGVERYETLGCPDCELERGLRRIVRLLHDDGLCRRLLPGGGVRAARDEGQVARGDRAPFREGKLKGSRVNSQLSYKTGQT